MRKSQLTGFQEFEFKLHRSSYRITLWPDYCAAVAKAIEPEPGKTWLRGNELLDGPIGDLPKVLLDIIDYELGLGRWAYDGQDIR
jgi:hypothetical protein